VADAALVEYFFPLGGIALLGIKAGTGEGDGAGE